MSDPAQKHEGGCLCGAVRYRVTGELRPVVACHCSQCRRTSGHHVAATAARVDELTVEGEAELTWFASSAFAKRGFCRICGSNLFWQGDGAERISIMAGTLDGKTGLRTAAHIFVGDKGDYYELAPGPPQHLDGNHGDWPSYPAPGPGERG